MRLIDAVFRQGHLSEQALVEAVMTGERPAHLDRCDLCADRAVELGRWLDDVARRSACSGRRGLHARAAGRAAGADSPQARAARRAVARHRLPEPRRAGRPRGLEAAASRRRGSASPPPPASPSASSAARSARGCDAAGRRRPCSADRDGTAQPRRTAGDDAAILGVGPDDRRQRAISTLHRDGPRRHRRRRSSS